MKRLILMTYLLAGCLAAFAQKEHRVYKFDHKDTPKEVNRYGEYPEFPLLRNMITKDQFVAAMHKQQGRNSAELNNILMAIGFDHGAKDVKAANVASEDIPEGTVGNMGDGGHNYLYAKLWNDGNGIRAWRVTADNGDYVYFISKCGNAFYPEPKAVAPATAMVTTPPAEPARPVCKDKLYIYYGGLKKAHHGWDVYADGMDEQKCSNPADNVAVVRAESEPAKMYNATDINVERTAEYLGYIPLDNGTYISHRQCVKKYRGCACKRW